MRSLYLGKLGTLFHTFTGNMSKYEVTILRQIRHFGSTTNLAGLEWNLSGVVFSYKILVGLVVKNKNWFVIWLFWGPWFWVLLGHLVDIASHIKCNIVEWSHHFLVTLATAVVSLLFLLVLAGCWLTMSTFLIENDQGSFFNPGLGVYRQRRQVFHHCW